MAEDINGNLSSDLGWTCNRGVPIDSPTEESTSRSSCFCPPSYYDDRCQYQNQKVSLTVQIRLTSEWRTIFVFLITRIDTETNIESHEHVQYIHSRDSETKYNIYLLYTTRPKNSSKTFFCANSRCQFSTEGLTPSLDIILGYHIRAKTSVTQQPVIVKTAIALRRRLFSHLA